MATDPEGLEPGKPTEERRQRHLPGSSVGQALAGPCARGGWVQREGPVSSLEGEAADGRDCCPLHLPGCRASLPGQGRSQRGSAGDVIAAFSCDPGSDG